MTYERNEIIVTVIILMEMGLERGAKNELQEIVHATIGHPSSCEQGHILFFANIETQKHYRLVTELLRTSFVYPNH